MRDAVIVSGECDLDFVIAISNVGIGESGH